MDFEKIKNKFQDLELVPKRNRKNADALNSSVKPEKSLKDVQQKYSVSNSEEEPRQDVGIGKDRNWSIGHFMPKSKRAVDSPMDEKLKMFDEEGNETAAQG